MGRYVVAITGASGAAYGRRVVGALCEGGHDVQLIVTAAGFLVLSHELDWDAPEYTSERRTAARCAAFFRPAGASGQVRYHPVNDVSGPLASGTTPWEAMAVVPCTMGRVAAIAHGLSSDLLERCAEVTLKEGRPLVVVPRETPLSLIHLRNLTALAEAGAVVLPAMPGFYAGARRLEDLVDFVAGKVLGRLGLPSGLPPWPGLADGGTRADGK